MARACRHAHKQRTTESTLALTRTRGHARPHTSTCTLLHPPQANATLSQQLADASRLLGAVREHAAELADQLSAAHGSCAAKDGLIEELKHAISCGGGSSGSGFAGGPEGEPEAADAAGALPCRQRWVCTCACVSVLWGVSRTGRQAGTNCAAHTHAIACRRWRQRQHDAGCPHPKPEWHSQGRLAAAQQAGQQGQPAWRGCGPGGGCVEGLVPAEGAPL
jgi:hypothetical protein